jgi:polyhydroxyalkanoate synthesis regulator phasin
METSLQSVNVTASDLTATVLPAYEEEGETGEHHLPIPSYWPLVAGVALFVTFIGLLLIPETPLLALLGAAGTLVGIIGWGLEDPQARAHHGEQVGHYGGYAPGAESAEGVSPLAEAIREQAQEVVDQLVVRGDLAWSAHPVNVEIEQEGVVLALYGKVELEAQRQAIEEAIRKLPRVIDVRNFIVAEEAILNEANRRIARLQESGKLEGARDIRVLVENYVVHLYGEVPTRQMKYLLEDELVQIPGVRVVVNHIGLNEEIPGELGHTKGKVGKG